MEDRKPSLLVELVYGTVGRFFFPNSCPLLLIIIMIGEVDYRGFIQL